MKTEEADRLHTLVIRARLPHQIGAQSLVAFNLHQFRDHPDRKTPTTLALAEAAHLLRETALMAEQLLLR